MKRSCGVNFAVMQVLGGRANFAVVRVLIGHTKFLNLWDGGTENAGLLGISTQR